MMANKLSEMEMELNEHKYESTNLYGVRFSLQKSCRRKYKGNFLIT